MMIGLPVFIVFFSVIALSAIPDASGRVVGIVAAVIAMLFVVLALRMPYVAIAGPDGSLTFKALGRMTETSIAQVSRISYRRSGGARAGGSIWLFYFDDTRAQLGNWAGRSLARYVIARNPAVQYPPGLRI